MADPVLATDLDANGATVRNLAEPVAADHAATKGYADGVVAGKIGPVTGTPNGSKYLRDDLSWQAVPGGGPAIDVDPTFAANSDLVVPSQKAARTAIDRLTPRPLIPAARTAPGDTRWLGTRLTGQRQSSGPSIAVGRGSMGASVLSAGTINALCINIGTASPTAGDLGDIACYRTGTDGLPTTLLWSTPIPVDTTGDVVVTGLSVAIPWTGAWAFMLWNRAGNGGAVTVTGADSNDAFPTGANNGSTAGMQIRATAPGIPSDLSGWAVQSGSGIDVLGGYSNAPMILGRRA